MTDHPTSSPCSSRYPLRGVTLRCILAPGHRGIHLADIVVNGEQCHTGWRGSEKGAYYANPEHDPMERRPT